MHPSLVLPLPESLEAREWLPERVETVEGDASMIKAFEGRLEIQLLVVAFSGGETHGD